MSQTGCAGIRTPDQRLRVFVSSTLVELAEERAAVARAISALRLTPVLFELGARPHPPRELYRAYLAQSDVFIGLYWQRYGWIGPEMEISGLEDEFELSASLPRLLYVKVPAPEREPALAALIQRVEREASGSYRTFRTPRELGRLVRNDLALLLSERFSPSAPPPAATTPPASPRRHPRSLPVATTSLIGRERDIDAVCGLLVRPEVRLVTLSGPGGIGKTRLAVAVGERLSDRFPAGAVFASLAAVREPDLVLPTVAAAAGVPLEGRQSALEALVEHFAEASALLVLDNLEQVVAVAPQLVELLARCAALTILATSRTALRVRAEHEYPVPPLDVPPPESSSWLEQLAVLPSVRLFVERARAVRHDFELTPANTLAVAEICRRLEGLPLAIELAAARTRLLEPAALLARLSTRLDALGTGPADLPERQRTLRATVEWSIGLLGEEEARLLAALSVFVDGWTLEAAAHVCDLDEDSALEALDALARNSLILVAPTEGGTRFRMLGTLREYAAERLAARPEADALRKRHAHYFRDLAGRADRHLRGLGQAEWADRLEAEEGNLRQAIRWFLAHEATALPHLFRVLWLFWWVRNRIAEAHGWVGELMPRLDALDTRGRAELLWVAAAMAMEMGNAAEGLEYVARIEPLLGRTGDPYLEGVLRLAPAWILPLVDDYEGAREAAASALEQLRGLDEPFMVATAMGTLAFLEAFAGRTGEARSLGGEMLEIGRRIANPAVIGPSQVWLGILDVMEGRLEAARTWLEQGALLILEGKDTQRLTLALWGLAELALAEGDARRAAVALGAAEGFRERVRLRFWPVVRNREAELLARLEQTLGAQDLAQALAEGAGLSRPQAVTAAFGRGDPPAAGAAREAFAR